MSGFVDVHQHIVYGVDDGPAELDYAVEMLRAAEAAGTRHVFATSHACPSMERFRARTYHQHLFELRRACDEHGIGVSLYKGCEVFASQVAVRLLGQRRLPTLGDTGFVLVEYDPTSSFSDVEDSVRSIANEGYTVVMAHCERYDAVVARLDDLARLKRDYPLRCQMNAQTLLLPLHGSRKRIRRTLLETGLIDYVASDGHSLNRRPPQLDKAFAQAEKMLGVQRAQALFGGNQQEILRDAVPVRYDADDE